MTARVAMGGGRVESLSSATVTAPAVRRPGSQTTGRPGPAAPNPMSRRETGVAAERPPLERPRAFVLSGDDVAAIGVAVPTAAPVSIAGSGSIARSRIARVRPTIGATLPVLLEPAPVEPDTTAVLGAILVVALVFAIVIVLSVVGL